MYTKEAQYYKKEINSIKQELAALPNGHLTKKGTRYYVTIGTVQKGISKNKHKVKQLARKAFLLRRLKHLEWNFSLVKKYISRLKTEEPVEIIQGLSSFYKTLPEKYFFHTSLHDKRKNTYEGNAGYRDELVYLTNSGISVRSKSERIIADALDLNEIPYNYEASLLLGGEMKCPDFTVYRPFDGKVILWEHFGLMDQNEYRQKAIDKLAFYNSNGFFPFDNLICTYEQDIQNPARIHTLIKTCLLQ